MGRRGVPVSADELFEYTPARSSAALSASHPSPSPSRHGSHAHGSHAAPTPARTRAQFVKANYSFAVSPTAVVSLEDPDVLDWGGVDVVFTPGAAPECPICLHAVTAPRITRCGHILDHVCALQLLHHNADAAGVARCPLCSDRLATADLRPVAFLEHVPPGGEPGETLCLQLVARPRYSVVPRPFCAEDMVADFAKLPSGTTPMEPFYSRLVVADTGYLLDLVAKSISDLEATLREDASLKPFVTAAKTIAKEEREQLRLRRRRQRVSELAAVATSGSAMEYGEHCAGVVSSTGVEAATLHAASSSSAGSADASPTLSAAGGGIVAEVGPALRGGSGVRSARRKDGSAHKSGSGDSSGGVLRWPPSTAKAHASPGMYVFFQARDGQHIFLHPLCHRIVTAEFSADFSRCPQVVDREVLQLDRLNMDEVLRKRYRFLGHLPLGCEFSFAEIDLRGVVSDETLAAFSAELAERESARKRKRVASERESKRMAKMETKQLRSYFQISDNIAKRREQATVDSTDLTSFPAIPFSRASSAASNGDTAASSEVSGAASSAFVGSPNPVEVTPWGASVSSFAAVSANMGVFPSLYDVTGTPAGSSSADAIQDASKPGPRGTTKAIMAPPRLGGQSDGARRLPSIAGASPTQGAWAESPPRGAWALSTSPGPSSASPDAGVPSPSRGLPPYPRKGRKQITVLSTAGPQHHRK